MNKLAVEKKKSHFLCVLLDIDTCIDIAYVYGFTAIQFLMWSSSLKKQLLLSVLLFSHCQKLKKTKCCVMGVKGERNGKLGCCKGIYSMSTIS